MTLPFDTHVLLWALMSPQRLPLALVDRVDQGLDEVFFSPVSIWEIAIKRALGRPTFLFEPGTVAAAAVSAGFEEVPIRSTHAARVATLPSIHADPFDRLLLAQAIEHGWTLVTADDLLLGYPAPIERIQPRRLIAD